MADGETITSATWILPTTLTKTAESNTGTATTVWLSGGAVNQNAVITCRVTTSSGRTDERSILLPIRNR